MTLYKPTIEIQRLIAKKGNITAFDQKFHPGINVLSGCNGGGKTSVIQLLMFGLGYEIIKWKSEAGSCNNIYVGLKINGNSITLRRTNNNTERQSLEICYLHIDNAVLSPIETWSNYPYQITASRESFSQKLFSILEIPEAKADLQNNNITIHQILRLIYSDQSNTSSSFFNSEQFDSAFKRESIGKYLLGIHDNELYDAKIKLAAEEKKLDKVVHKLSAIFSVIGQTSFVNNLTTLEEEKEKYIKSISFLKEEITKIRQDNIISQSKEKDITKKYANESIKIKNELLDCESLIQSLQYEILDSEEFIAELHDKNCAINDSLRVDKYKLPIVFKTCPNCHKSLEKSTLADHCHLCGHPEETQSTEGSINLIRMKNEISIQIDESERLLTKKKEKLEEQKLKSKQIQVEMRKTLTKISSTITALNTSNESELYKHYNEIGETEEKIATLEKISELYESIKTLTTERDLIQSEVNKYKSFIELKTNTNKSREPEILGIISSHLIDILKLDIGAEGEFKNANTIEFDFASNTISVNGKSTFSESGMVFLNNAFHFSLFLSSLDKNYVRIPRFMILDGIENGGMEDSRSKNFQKIIYDILKDKSVDCQIIFATKSIYHELNNNNYVIGETLTKSNKSLLI